MSKVWPNDFAVGPAVADVQRIVDEVDADRERVGHPCTHACSGRWALLRMTVVENGDEEDGDVVVVVRTMKFDVVGEDVQRLWLSLEQWCLCKVKSLPTSQDFEIL